MDLDKICDTFQQVYRTRKPFATDRECGTFLRYIIQALQKGNLIYPQNEKELEEEARDIVNGIFAGEDLSFLGTSQVRSVFMTYRAGDDDYSNTDTSVLQGVARNGANKWKNVVVNVYLTLEKGGNIDGIDEYFEKVAEQIQKNYNLKIENVVVDFGENNLDKKKVRYLIDEKGLQNLVKLQKVVDKSNGKLLFHEMHSDSTYWDLDQVIKANECINDLAKTIKDNNLSPFEALLYICTWAQKNIAYYDIEEGNEKTNTIVAAVNNQKIRCVGFSQFVEAVVDTLAYQDKDNELKSNGMLTVAYSKSRPFASGKVYASNHAQTACYVKDEKYNMNGEVIVDPLGFRNYGLDLRKLDGGITLLSMSPIATFSRLKQRNKQYKIYSGDLEVSNITSEFKPPFRMAYYVDGKSQRQVLRETHQNERIAQRTQQHGINQSQYRRAYSKIIPIVFEDVKEGDIVAPTPTIISPNNWSCDKTIEISKGFTREFWEETLSNLDNSPAIYDGEEERIL